MLVTRDRVREGPADDETIAAWIIERKAWDVDDRLRADVLKRARDALQREQKVERGVQDFGPKGCLWKLAQ